MVSYIVRRLLLMFPTLVGITLLVFLVMAWSPGGVGGSLIRTEGNVDPTQRRAIKEYLEKRYGLDKPVLVQYGRWLNQISPAGFDVSEDGKLGRFRLLKWPNLGYSFAKSRPVSELMLEAVPTTLMLNALSIPLVYSIAIGSGLLAARKPGSVFDTASGFLFFLLWSLPTIWVGVMMLGFLCNEQYLNWFPAAGLQDSLMPHMPMFPHREDGAWVMGRLLDLMWHVVLPVTCLSYAGFAYLSRLTRTSLLENIRSDYVRTALAKGLDQKQAVMKHALPNSLLPLITVASGIIPALLGGSVVVETLFSVPGLGFLGVDAVKSKDRELVLSTTLIVSMISLLSAIMRDILYAVADPRVSYE